MLQNVKGLKKVRNDDNVVTAVGVVFVVYQDVFNPKPLHFMIKALLALSAALVCANGLMAQNLRSHAATAMKPLAGNPATAQKTTATGSRLVAATNLSYMSGAYELDDTARCQYGNNTRGYDYKVDQWRFDNATTWAINGSALEEVYRMHQVFDSKDRITATTYEANDGTQWFDEEYMIYVYDAAGNIASDTDKYFDGTDWNESRNTYTYDAAGRLTSQVREEYDLMTNQWRNSMKVTNTYNAAGQIATSVTDMWNNGQWQPNMRSTHTYANGRRTETLTEQHDGSTWKNSGISLFTYDAAGNVTVEEYKWWQNGAWEPYNRNTNDYDNNNDMIATVREVAMMGQYNYISKLAMAYNSYHQTTVETDYSWDAGSNQFVLQDGDYQTRYYYEAFTNSVKDSKATAGSMSVYPVPAKGVLHLRTAMATATAADAALLDVSGRVVLQQHLPTATQHNATLNVANLAPGIYTLQLNAGGKLMTQKVVVE